MKKKISLKIFILLSVLITVSFACSALSGGDQDSASAPVDAESNETASVTDLPTEPARPEPTEQTAPEVTQPTPPTEQPAQPSSDQSPIDTDFPLPDDVQNIMQLDDNTINFQTNMSLQEVVDFYRKTFTTQGLNERTLLTSITDTTVSMVFDGAPNGLAIVLQCVDLGGDSTNVNLRYEDV